MYVSQSTSIASGLVDLFPTQICRQSRLTHHPLLAKLVTRPLGLYFLVSCFNSAQYVDPKVPVGLADSSSTNMTWYLPTGVSRLDLPVISKSSYLMQICPLRNNPSLAHRKACPVWTQIPLADFHRATLTNQRYFRLEDFWLLEITGIAMVKIVSRFELERRGRRRFILRNEVISPHFPS